MKRLTALLMACILTASIWLPQTVYGAPNTTSPSTGPVLQAPVNELRLFPNSTDTPGSDVYNYYLEWQRPGYSWPASQDKGAILPPPGPAYNLNGPPDGWTAFATDYIVNYRNATPNRNDFNNEVSEALIERTDSSSPVISRPDTEYSSKMFEPGSFYEFWVEASHENYYRTGTDTDGNPTYGWLPAGEDTGSHVLPEMRAIYMTDINVEAVGEGNTLTVTWTHPSWGSADPFIDGYQISHQIQRADGTTEPISTPESIGLDDPSLVLLPDGRYQYKIIDNSLEVGERYNAYVEPVWNGDKLRLDNPSLANINAYNTIRMDDMVYRIYYRNPSDHPYVTETPALIVPHLTGVEESEQSIRLTWSPLSSFIDEDIRVELVQLDPETGEIISRIIVLNGLIATEINSYPAPKPDAPSEYRLDIYTPADATTPQSTNTWYYDPNYTDFDPYMPTILSLTADKTDNLNRLNMTWLAFSRRPYTDDEEESVEPPETMYPANTYIDRELTFDIYVTDNFDALNGSAPVLEDVAPGTLDLKPWPEGASIPGSAVPSYTVAPVQQYYHYDPETAQYELMDLTDNKVYYVMIRATRNVSGQLSRPAYGSVYMPAGDIVLDPNMIAAPPLREKSVTENSAIVTWDTKYIEALNTGDGEWYAVMGVDPSGNAVYGKSAVLLENSSQMFILNDKINKPELYKLSMSDPVPLYAFLQGSARDAVLEALSSLNPPASNLGPSDPTLRLIDLTEADYEFHVVRYDLMMEEGDEEQYENYYTNNLVNNPDAWTVIESTEDTENPGSLLANITQSNEPTGTLAANTAYVVYMRPFITTPDGAKLYAYYPNYVMITTSDTKPPVSVTPTTPVLIPVEEGDTELTVKWKQLEMEYTLKYAESVAEYPAGGTTVAWDKVSAGHEVILEEDGTPYMHYTIEGLFPDTQYYIWIQAKSPSNETPSAWSNPVDMRTTDIETPMPPQGLGPAAKDHVDAYNVQNTTEYLPTEEEALIIEWMRNGEDNNDAAAGGTATGGTAEVLPLKEVANMYMVRFNELIANRSYYIRAKTVLTVSRSGPGGEVTRKYNYIIQVSPNIDFKDAITFTLPDMTPTAELDSVNNRRKESEWSNAIRLYTDETDGEYDGAENPDHYPLPDQDWELTYDPGTGTLRYRFRSDQVGADGKKDQLADQRFISRLVAGRTFTFKVDLSAYNNQQINMRVVEMPYSILQAFEERKITLEVTADNMVASVPPGSFNTNAVRALPGYGVGARAQLNLTAGTANTPQLAAGESYTSQPQKLSAQVITSSQTVNIDIFAQPISIKMALNSRVLPQEQNVGLYYGSGNTGGWSQIGGQYAPSTATLDTTSKRAGSYAAIAKATPAVPVNDPSLDAMHRVTAKLNFTDLPQYDSAAYVTPDALNNVIAAIANNRSSVSLTAALSASDKQALERGKMLVTPNAQGSYSRDAAISSLVTLYELKTKRVIQPAATIASTPYSGIASAPEAYRYNLLKAADIGFLDSQTNNYLIMGDFMRMLDIIIQDSGM